MVRRPTRRARPVPFASDAVLAMEGKAPETHPLFDLGRRSLIVALALIVEMSRPAEPGDLVHAFGPACAGPVGRHVRPPTHGHEACLRAAGQRLPILLAEIGVFREEALPWLFSAPRGGGAGLRRHVQGRVRWRRGRWRIRGSFIQRPFLGMCPAIEGEASRVDEE